MYRQYLIHSIGMQGPDRLKSQGNNEYGVVRKKRAWRKDEEHFEIVELQINLEKNHL